MKSTNTLRSSLLKVKQARSDRIGHVYTYIGKTGRTLKKQLSEHKTAAKNHATKNRIAVHSWANQHHADQLGRGKRLLEEKGPRGPTHPSITRLCADY